MLNRELQQRGLHGDSGGFSAKLIGWLEERGVKMGNGSSINRALGPDADQRVAR
jgi:IS4 transposase